MRLSDPAHPTCTITRDTSRLPYVEIVEKTDSVSDDQMNIQTGLQSAYFANLNHERWLVLGALKNRPKPEQAEKASTCDNHVEVKPSQQLPPFYLLHFLLKIFFRLQGNLRAPTPRREYQPTR